MSKIKRKLLLLGATLFFLFGTLINENYLFDDSLGFAILLYYFSAILIVLSIFKTQLFQTLFYGFFLTFLLMYISLKLTDFVEVKLIESETVLINGIITEKTFGQNKKMHSTTWHYKYEFEVNNQKYENKVSFDDEKYDKNDSVTIKYYDLFPQISRILKNE